MIKVNKLTSEELIQIDIFAEKLVPLYELFNWQWFSWPVTKNDIIRTIRDLINDVNSISDCCSTGWLTAERMDWWIIEIRWSLDKSIYIWDND